MSQDNQITLRGFLTAEPKFHQKTPAATPLTEIRVGSTPRRLNRETGEWHDAPTSYYLVKCWRRLAINAASSLHKGDMVVVRGHFYMNRWVDNQQRPRATLEIEADSLGHDLTYGWSHFLRSSRSQPERSAAINAGEFARQNIGPAADPGNGDRVAGPDGDPGREPDGDEYPGAGEAGGPGEGAVASGAWGEQAGSTVVITESDSSGGREAEGAPAMSDPPDASGAPEAEPEAAAVPF